MKRQECGRAKTAREVRRDASPRIEGRKVKGILILSGKTFSLFILLSDHLASKKGLLLSSALEMA